MSYFTKLLGRFFNHSEEDIETQPTDNSFKLSKQIPAKEFINNSLEKLIVQYNKDNHLSAAELFGRVKGVKIYDQESSEDLEIPIQISSYLYNTSGNVQSVNHFNQRDIKYNSQTYTYDKGLLLKITDDKQNFIKPTYRVFSYDEKNRLTSTKSYIGESLDGTETNFYNDKDQLIEENYHTDNQHISKTSNIYKDGLLHKVISYMLDNNNSKTSESIFDKNENMVKQTHFDYKEDVTEIWEYDYNDLGLKTEARKVTKTANVIESIKFDYVYDLEYNWIEKYKLENNVYKLIIKREITYYD